MHTAPSNALTIRVFLAQAERALAEGPYPDKARRDAQALLLHLLRNHAPATNLAWLIAHEDENLPAGVLEGMRDLVERRAAGEPLQHITGETEFYRLPIAVSRDVLIPRPETELLVEKALELGSPFRRPRILDVGTGSGAIAIALAHEWPEAVLTATEISDRALKLARHNAERLGVANRIRFLHGDLLEPVASEQFELIVSNPPYVAERDRGALLSRCATLSLRRRSSRERTGWTFTGVLFRRHLSRSTRVDLWSWRLASAKWRMSLRCSPNPDSRRFSSRPTCRAFHASRRRSCLEGRSACH